MARKIAWEDLPEWAKRAIEKAGRFGVTQITRDSASLSVSDGVARYNGVEVAPKGVLVTAEDRQDEVVFEDELPVWARVKVRGASAGGQVQMVNGYDTLQVSGGVVFFNGRKVIYRSSVVISEEKPVDKITIPVRFYRTLEWEGEITVASKEEAEQVIAKMMAEKSNSDYQQINEEVGEYDWPDEFAPIRVQNI